MSCVPYTIVNLDQGTPEWLEWRSQGIGASDAPVIVGENPWKSAAQLLDQKCGNSVVVSNEAMMRGSALEPEARRRFENKLGVTFLPACLQSSNFEWLRASVDGLAVDGSVVVEIKCGESVYKKTFSSGKVPVYYYGQLQHILAVTGMSVIDFWCYLPNRPELHLRVDRDETYINRMLDLECRFWETLKARRMRI